MGGTCSGFDYLRYLLMFYLVRICFASISLDTITSCRMITAPILRCTDGAERGGKTIDPTPSEWRYATSSHRPDQGTK